MILCSSSLIAPPRRAGDPPPQQLIRTAGRDLTPGQGTRKSDLHLSFFFRGSEGRGGEEFSEFQGHVDPVVDGLEQSAPVCVRGGVRSRSSGVTPGSLTAVALGQLWHTPVVSRRVWAKLPAYPPLKVRRGTQQPVVQASC